MRTNHRYTKHDWRLYNAVAKFKPLKDGLVSVEVRGDWQTVRCYGNAIFRRNAVTQYWEAATWGCNRHWLFEKVNACLHAVNADVRLYEEGRRFALVRAGGASMRYRDSFNSEVFK